MERELKQKRLIKWIFLVSLLNFGLEKRNFLQKASLLLREQVQKGSISREKISFDKEELVRVLPVMEDSLYLGTNV